MDIYTLGFFTTGSKSHNIFQILKSKQRYLKKSSQNHCTRINDLPRAWWMIINYQVIKYLHLCGCFPVNNIQWLSYVTNLRSFQWQYVTFSLLWIFKNFFFFAITSVFFFFCSYITFSLWDPSKAKCYRRIQLLYVVVVHKLIKISDLEPNWICSWNVPSAEYFSAESLILLVSSSNYCGGPFHLLTGSVIACWEETRLQDGEHVVSLHHNIPMTGWFRKQIPLNDD